MLYNHLLDRTISCPTRELPKQNYENILVKLLYTVTVRNQKQYSWSLPVSFNNIQNQQYVSIELSEKHHNSRDYTQLQLHKSTTTQEITQLQLHKS